MFHSIKNIIVICRFLLHFVIPTKEESLCCKDSSFHFVPFRMTSVRYYINCIFLQISVHLWQTEKIKALQIAFALGQKRYHQYQKNDQKRLR